MHVLHAILVELDPCKSDRPIEELWSEARDIAMGGTEDFADEVFDWRTEDNAGRWSDEFPGSAVILGVVEPERLRKLLDSFSVEPLNQAKAILAFVRQCLGGVVPSLDEGFLDQLWSSDLGPESCLAYELVKMFQLIDGGYTFDSGFYSIPDSSSRLTPETRKRVAEHPEQFALVFSDYHF